MIAEVAYYGHLGFFGNQKKANMLLFNPKIIFFLRKLDSKLRSFARFAINLYLATVELNDFVGY